MCNNRVMNGGEKLKALEDEIYTIDQIAKMLSVHKDAVISWIEQEKLGSVKIGHRTVRILQSDVDKFIRDHHRESNYPPKRINFSERAVR